MKYTGQKVFVSGSTNTSFIEVFYAAACRRKECVYHVRNQSLTNVTVYIQVYMQVYLYIYIHIYVQVDHNFDTFYATKLKFRMTQTKTLEFMVELPLGGARVQNV